MIPSRRAHGGYVSRASCSPVRYLRAVAPARGLHHLQLRGVRADVDDSKTHGPADSLLKVDEPDSGNLYAEHLGVLGQALEAVRPQVFEDRAPSRRRGRARFGWSAPRRRLPSRRSAHPHAPPCRSTRRRASRTRRCARPPGSGCRGWPARAPDPDRTEPPSSGRRRARRFRRRCAWPADRRTSRARVDEPVVVVEVPTPVLVALGGEQFRRADDVGEQNGAQHTFGGHRICLLANESQHFLREQVDQIDRVVFARRQLPQLGVRDPRRQLLGRSNGAMRSPLRCRAPWWVCARCRARRGRRSPQPPATSCAPSSGSPHARCSLPNISRTPGTSATGPKNQSAKAPSPQWFSRSS